MTLTTWQKQLAAAAGSIAAVGVIWTAGDATGLRPVLKNELVLIQSQLDQTTETLLLLEWQQLNEKAKNGELSPWEREHFCKVSRQLGYQVPGCAS